MPVRIDVKTDGPGLTPGEVNQVVAALGNHLLDVDVGGQKSAGGIASGFLSILLTGEAAIAILALKANGWKERVPARTIHASVEGADVDLSQLGERAESSDFAFRVAISEFVSATARSDARRVLRAHPELMTERADALLGEFVAAAQQAGDGYATRLFESCRGFLRLCKEVGPDAAFRSAV